jgi:hypothetical protein
MAFAPIFQRPFSSPFDRRAAVAAAAGNGLLNALVAYWKLDEASGNALDAHTNGLTLTQVDGPGAGTGKVYSTARTFDGSADYFRRASQTLLQTGDVDFTLAAWVYLTSKTNIAMIVAKVDTAGREYMLYYNSGTDRWTVTVYRATDTGVSAVANNHGAVTADQWCLVTAWHDATADTLSISVNNGTADTQATGGALQAASTNEFQIGSRILPASSFRFPGRIGPVAMWKSAAGNGGVLSAAQRTALWDAGNGLAYSAFTT